MFHKAFHKMADETTLSFIEDYRDFPQLWDTNNKLYSNKVKRHECLQVLATKYNTDIDGVKKKIKSLRSYFSKEHHKVLRKKVENDDDEPYVSQWFAYKPLLFTAESMTTRNKRRTSTPDEKDDEHSEVSNRFLYCSAASSSSMSEDEDEFRPTLPSLTKKRNALITQTVDKKEETHKLMKKETEDNNISQNEECNVYGQLIAIKLQNFNRLNRLLAQQRINNILFDLEMQQMTSTGDDSAAVQYVTKKRNEK